MADFQYFQAEAGKRGKVMCMHCFGTFPRHKMEPDSKNTSKVWDVCKSCAKVDKDNGGKY